MSFVPYVKPSTKTPYIPSMAYLDCRVDPDKIEHHVALKSNMKTFLPVHKSEEDIERMWEYNKMMGRS